MMTQLTVEGAWTHVNSKHTHTLMSAHQVIQYLQQNTQEMDLLSSPDATQGGGKQNDRFGGKRKDGHRRGWDRGELSGLL